MSKYLVSFKINIVVEINEDNVWIDPRTPLQGDTPQTAINRALLCYLRGMGLSKELRNKLGVGRTFTKKHDWEVVSVED